MKFKTFLESELPDKEVQALYLLKMSRYHIENLMEIITKSGIKNDLDWLDLHAAHVHVLDMDIFYEKIRGNDGVKQTKGPVSKS